MREPLPFNPEYRPGFGLALHEAYTAWSIANPEHTRKQGLDRHAQLAELLTPSYPKWTEIPNYGK